MEKDVVEKKNRTLPEFARSMLNEYDLLKYFFWRKRLILPVIFQIEF